MGYTDIDRKAINTIRTLAVSLSQLREASDYPAVIVITGIDINATIRNSKTVGMEYK